MLMQCRDVQCDGIPVLHSRKLTWKPKKGPIQTIVLLRGDYMGFHVSLGGCRFRISGLRLGWVWDSDLGAFAVHPGPIFTKTLPG